MTDDLLINTLESPGEFDSLTSLRKGEPYFALVGRDRSAPDLVLQWVKLRRQRLDAEREAGTITPEDLDHELAKCLQAERIAWAMTAYKAGHEVAKRAEAAPKPTYTGHELPEETKRRDAIQSASIRTRQALNAAVAEVMALQDAIADLPEPSNKLEADEFASVWNEGEQLVGPMRRLSDSLTPKRPIGAAA